jgi:hypothetical protein
MEWRVSLPALFTRTSTEPTERARDHIFERRNIDEVAMIVDRRSSAGRFDPADQGFRLCIVDIQENYPGALCNAGFDDGFADAVCPASDNNDAVPQARIGREVSSVEHGACSPA